jgi:HD-GYP domain-containing protein (c-di-GMP phosphodiesterase class II)
MTSKPEATDYVPFRVSTLRGDQKIDFNAYLRINDKHILYVRRGDSFEGLRIKKLKEKKLKQMFIKPEEEHLYRQYIERNIDMAYDKNSGKSITNRAEIIQGSQESAAEEVFENPVSEIAYNEAKSNMDKFVNFLQTENEAFQAMMNIENVDQNIAHHGVTVATLSTMAMQKLNFDPKQVNLVALGGLLHDFDHYHNGLQVNKPLSQFSADELAKYKRHPQNGSDAVKDKKHFDPLVAKIILQHEEHMDGSGFPNKLKERDLEKGSLMVASANAMDRLITFEGIPRHQAPKELMVNRVGHFPLEYIRTLAEMVSKLPS